MHGTVIEHYYDEHGCENEPFAFTDIGDCSDLLIPADQSHFLEDVDDMAVIFEAKAGRYDQC
ncbi:hypothetical protein K0G02_06665 [Bacteroides pyogenes]|nr:hypothetical protein [Bacteroides pyogenes]